MTRGRLLMAAVMAVAVCAGVVVDQPDRPVSAADAATVTCSPVGATGTVADADLASFEAVVPERIVDTRDGTGGVTGALGAGCTLIIDTTGIGPDTAVGYALSVTVISPVTGFFTAFPCAGGLPGTSSVNARPGFPTPNLVVATPDDAGRVCLYSDRGGHAVVDVSGWWADGDNRFTPVDPVRAYDTRELASPVKLPADAIRDVAIGGAYVPEDAVAVTVNVAAVLPETRGFLVVYPCGEPVPLASNLNFTAGEKRAVSAIVALGAGGAAEGKICVSASATTHFIVDVTGYVAPSAPTSPDLVLDAVADTRVVDSRDGTRPGVRFQPGVAQTFDLSSAIDRPDEAVAVVLNVVAVRADRPSFVTVSPCQSGTPATSSLNYDLGQTANLVVTALTDAQEICIVAASGVDVVVDLVGVFTGPPDSLVNQLSFSRDGTVVALDQDFAVDGENATLHCDGAVDLGLRLGLAPGVTARVNGVVVPERDPVTPDIAVAIPAEGLVRIALQRGSERADYYVRCLPADFSRLNVTVSGDTAPGWYITELGWQAGAQTRDKYIVIMDERGVPVWFKRTGTPNTRVINPHLLSTGEIVVSPITGIGFGVDPAVGHRVYTLDGALVDQRLTVGPENFPVDHHDYVELPASAGGGYAAVSYPRDLDFDLRDLELPPPFAANDCPASVKQENGEIVDGVIQEITPAGTLAWEWTMSDHFGVDESTFAQCFKNYGNPGEVDLFHINSLQRIEDGTGDYMVSARHVDAVFRVDRATGNVDWILGSDDDLGNPGPPNKSGAQRLNIVGDPLGGPLRMHDARLQGDLLTLYDNRTADPESNPSRAVAYRIDTTGPPSTWTATLEWELPHPNAAVSGQIGSNRITPDGSILVGWGATQPMFVEYAGPSVESELLRIEIPGESAYRIVKYAPAAFSVAELRATAGGTLELP